MGQPPGRRIDVEDAIRTILDRPRTWAVVGCSPDPSRDSHRIATLLKRRGNTVIPVNPARRLGI